MAANPNPSRIADPTWRLWEETAADTPGIRLGGIFANKRCYHNGVEDNLRNWPGSYCIRLALDLVSYNRKYARAIDWTMSDAEMRKRTNRLRASALDDDDNRLFAMREFIGTRDGDNVYCLIKDDEDGPWRFDGGRDSSHLWHIHGSMFTKYVNDWEALEGIVSVWVGESLVEWKARKEGGGTLSGIIGLRWGDGIPEDRGGRGSSGLLRQRVKALQVTLGYAGFPPEGGNDGQYGDNTAAAMAAMHRAAHSNSTSSGKSVTGYGYARLFRLLANRRAKKELEAMMEQAVKPAIEAAMSDVVSQIPEVQLPTSVVLDLSKVTVPVEFEDEPVNDPDEE